MKRTSVCLYLEILISMAFFSCTFLSTKVHQADKTTEGTVIRSPAKAHLYDGSMILFVDGFRISQKMLEGKGIRYDLIRGLSAPHTPTLAAASKRDTVRSSFMAIPIDPIAFLEYYRKQLQPGPLIGGLIAPVVFLAAIQNEDIKKAIFGSCPTIYASHDRETQAECFSYSISPYLETDDLDRIDPGTPVDEHIVLNVKNENISASG